MSKTILFITWDGPQTSYLEGLFMPIFHEISKKTNVSFHIVQFTWASKKKTQIVKEKALKFGITYTCFKSSRKPSVFFGSIFSMMGGCFFLNNYIKSHNIDVIMPRSTYPLVMLNMLKLKNNKIIFDADGLPLEERVDFSGLSKHSMHYKWLKGQELKMLRRAENVITRSKYAIEHHIKNIGEQHRSKFRVVYNGRDPKFFIPNPSEINSKRLSLNISENDFVFVYCGSLGPQYGWKEMIAIFVQYLKINQKAKLLILTGSPEFANKNVPEGLKNKVIVKSVPFEDVPKYLNISDIAFAIRDPKISMQGVAPIKLGEYLLMGLPTIASAGIGDTQTILKDVPNCFLFQHDDENRIKNTISFIESLKTNKSDEIRKIGSQYFSIEKSAESYLKVINKINS